MAAVAGDCFLLCRNLLCNRCASLSVTAPAKFQPPVSLSHSFKLALTTEGVQSRELNAVARVRVALGIGFRLGNLENT